MKPYYRDMLESVAGGGLNLTASLRGLENWLLVRLSQVKWDGRRMSASQSGRATDRLIGWASRRE